MTRASASCQCLEGSDDVVIGVIWESDCNVTRPAVAFTLLAGPFYLLYVGGGLDWALGSTGAPRDERPVPGRPLRVLPAGARRRPRRAAAGACGAGRLMFGLLPAFGVLALLLSNAATGAGEAFYPVARSAVAHRPRRARAGGGRAGVGVR